jgi:hypothetical protein
MTDDSERLDAIIARLDVLIQLEAQTRLVAEINPGRRKELAGVLVKAGALKKSDVEAEAPQ